MINNSLKMKTMVQFPLSAYLDWHLRKVNSLYNKHNRLYRALATNSHQNVQGKEGDKNAGNYSSAKETHFGFETVSEQEKAQKVKAVFENVAARYDVMNDAMSMGVHRVWKDIFVNRIGTGENIKLIDVAGGTGDIAFRFLTHRLPRKRPGIPSIMFSDLGNADHDRKIGNEVEAQYHVRDNAEAKDPSARVKDELLGNRFVLVCDINDKMLEVGKKRATQSLSLSEQQRIDWLVGDAENLHSVPDNSFDVYTIAFGIRNCVHVDKVISEAYRILKPGGRFLCLEFSHVSNSMLKWVYDQYSFQVIPAMGQVIAGDWDSYKYLVESIRKFPTQKEFKAMIEEAGFRFVTYENLTFGISAIHSGFKL